MLQISKAFVDTVASARSGSELHEMVAQAIRLEFSTIPPYLTAMMSLQPGKNREIWATIHDVVIDEMLHMTIAANILNALGGRPPLNDPDFLPTYPGPLPMAIGDGLIVSLEKFSVDLMKNVFMEIEEPDKPIRIPRAAAAEDFSTIGAFYGQLKATLLGLGDGVFIGDSGRQVIPTQWFGERVFPIGTAVDAARAIDLIVAEGEGTPDTPLDPDGEFAHYYRFEELSRLRRIAKDPGVTEGYSFSGPVVPFAASAVWDITPNQKLSDLDQSSLGGRRASQFSFVFTKLMRALERTFDGEPELFDSAMGLMFELKLAGQMLVQLPAVSNGTSIGKNAGPVFEYSNLPI